jgi:pimeloyl-ACP methyl ester carboxylesterase
MKSENHSTLSLASGQKEIGQSKVESVSSGPSEGYPTPLHWEVKRGSGPYLLLVHGFLSSRSQWLPNIEALSKVVTPVIIELFGHGRSPSPKDPQAYTPQGYVKVFEQIRQALSARRWFICGQSLGASLTLHYALSHPKRIQAQIFTNSRSAFYKTDKQLSMRTSKKFSIHMLLEKGTTVLERLPIHPIHARHLSADIKSALVSETANLDPIGVANLMRYTRPETSVRDKIHTNQVPALLVSGRYEKGFQPYRDFVASAMPYLEIIDLDAGHAVNLGDSEGFNKAVTAFIKRYG